MTLIERDNVAGQLRDEDWHWPCPRGSKDRDNEVGARPFPRECMACARTGPATAPACSAAAQLKAKTIHSFRNLNSFHL
jgi:hypothetical protein